MAVHLNGPSGIPKLAMALSIWYTSAPCSARRNAAWKYGTNMRLTTEPEQFLKTTGVFLIFRPKFNRLTIAWEDVFLYGQFPEEKNRKGLHSENKQVLDKEPWQRHKSSMNTSSTWTSGTLLFDCVILFEQLYSNLHCCLRQICNHENNVFLDQQKFSPLRKGYRALPKYDKRKKDKKMYNFIWYLPYQFQNYSLSIKY